MNLFRILHIGDVHYDVFTNSANTKPPRLTDINSAIYNSLYCSPPVIIFEEILRDAHRDVDAILFSGDFTSFGNIDIYNLFMANLLKIFPSDNSRLSKILFLCSPGNHDIIRRDPAKSKNIMDKYSPIIEICNNFRADFISGSYSFRQVSTNNSLINIGSISSCHGCGEISKHDESLLLYVNGDPISALDDHEYIKHYDYLNTPSYNHNDIRNLVNTIKDNNSSISIILSHHNILPQHFPVLGTSSEVMNAGSLRYYLNSIESNLVFIHGHIHSFSHELITNNKSNILVCSAPLLSNGYIIYDLVFSNSGLVLGVMIQYKQYINGTFTSHLFRYSFVNSSNFRSYLNDTDYILLQCFKSFKLEQFNFMEFYTYVQDNHQCPTKTVYDFLSILCWSNLLVELDDIFPFSNRCFRRLI